jgi:hypothetical protein
MGGDVGVFAHGDNAREMELLVRYYGLTPLQVLRQASSGVRPTPTTAASKPACWPTWWP